MANKHYLIAQGYASDGDIWVFIPVAKLTTLMEFYAKYRELQNNLKLIKSLEFSTLDVNDILFSRVGEELEPEDKTFGFVRENAVLGLPDSDACWTHSFSDDYITFIGCDDWNRFEYELDARNIPKIIEEYKKAELVLAYDKKYEFNIIGRDYVEVEKDSRNR